MTDLIASGSSTTISSPTAQAASSTTKSEQEDDRKDSPTRCRFFVGGIAPEVWEPEVKTYFEGFGTVREVRIVEKKDSPSKRHRGFCFVTMGSEEEKKKVFSVAHSVCGTKVDVRDIDQDPLRRKVFVGGLKSTLPNDVVKSYFSRFGPVEDVSHVMDNQGKSRGFGFVIFQDEASCQKALEQKSHMITLTDRVDIRPAEKNIVRRNQQGGYQTMGYSNQSAGAYDAYGGAHGLPYGPSFAHGYGPAYGSGHPSAFGMMGYGSAQYVSSTGGTSMPGVYNASRPNPGPATYNAPGQASYGSAQQVYCQVGQYSAAPSHSGVYAQQPGLGQVYGQSAATRAQPY